MRARVLFRDAQGRSGEVDLSAEEPCYIGRALDCAVRTDDAMVSRKHSLIRGETGRFVIEDLGSSNGTHVNDIKVERQALNHNDVVRCGNLWLRYVEEAERVAAAAPSAVPASAAPAEVAASPSGPSKYRSTLGGGSQPPGTPPIATPAPPTPTPPPPPAPSAARGRSLPPTEAPSPAADSDASASASPFESTQDGTGPGQKSPPRPQIPPTMIRPVQPAADATPPPASPASIEIGGGNRMPVRPQSADATPIAMSHARATTGPSADEIERSLRLAVARAQEIERGLKTLQGELTTAQEKIRTLLSVVQEITSIEVE